MSLYVLDRDHGACPQATKIKIDGRVTEFNPINIPIVPQTPDQFEASSERFVQKPQRKCTI